MQNNPKNNGYIEPVLVDNYRVSFCTTDLKSGYVAGVKWTIDQNNIIRGSFPFNFSTTIIRKAIISIKPDFFTVIKTDRPKPALRLSTLQTWYIPQPPLTYRYR